MALYKEHGVNPVAGCLPMLLQMPIWIALYRMLVVPNSVLRPGEALSRTVVAHLGPKNYDDLQAADISAGFQTGFNKVIDLGWFAFGIGRRGPFELRWQPPARGLHDARREFEDALGRCRSPVVRAAARVCHRR